MRILAILRPVCKMAIHYSSSDPNGTAACYQRTYEECFQCKHGGLDAARLRMPVFQNSRENAAKASNDSDST